MELAKRLVPYKEKPEPSRPKERREMDDAQHMKSSTDSPEPNLLIPKTEVDPKMDKEYPTLPMLRRDKQDPK